MVLFLVIIAAMLIEPSPLHPALAAGAPIERRSKLSAEEFHDEYEVKNKPVIVTEMLCGWPALGKWTPEFFAERYGDKVIKFKYGGLEMKMREFIDLVVESSSDKPAPYWTNAPVNDYFPELGADLEPMPPYFSPNWATRSYLHKGMKSALNRGAQLEIFIGGPGGTFPILHWDGLSTHAFLMQVYGTKQYWAWPPADDALMYPQKDIRNLSPIRDVEHPDLEKYPLFAKARATTFILEPGELLFVPSRWWHTAKMLSPSITLSINKLNRVNWSGFTEDMTHNQSGVARLAKSCYLAMEGARHSLKDFLTRE